MIHYLYVGHFARDRDFIRFEKKPDGSLRPAVTHPLSPDLISSELERAGVTNVEIPEDWGLWFEDDGFLVCDQHTHHREAIDMVRRIAAQTGCAIADYSSLSFVSPSELRYAWDPDLAPETPARLFDELGSPVDIGKK